MVHFSFGGEASTDELVLTMMHPCVGSVPWMTTGGGRDGIPGSGGGGQREKMDGWTDVPAKNASLSPCLPTFQGLSCHEPEGRKREGDDRGSASETASMIVKLLPAPPQMIDAGTVSLPEPHITVRSIDQTSVVVACVDEGP